MQVVAGAKCTNAACGTAQELFLSTGIGTSPSMDVLTTHPHDMWDFSSNFMTQNYYWPSPGSVPDDITSLMCGLQMPVETWTLGIFENDKTG